MGWLKAGLKSQFPALRVSYSGLFASLSTAVKDVYLENQINGNKKKASKHK